MILITPKDFCSAGSEKAIRATYGAARSCERSWGLYHFDYDRCPRCETHSSSRPLDIPRSTRSMNGRSKIKPQLPNNKFCVYRRNKRCKVTWMINAHMAVSVITWAPKISAAWVKHSLSERINGRGEGSWFRNRPTTLLDGEATGPLRYNLG